MENTPRRWPLWRKIFCLALLNLLLLGAVLVIFARLQFGSGPETFLFGPARDRIVTIANAFRVDLANSTAETRAELFAAYHQRYAADFFLTTPRGEAVLGPSVNLPEPVLQRMRTQEGRPMRPPPGFEAPPGFEPPPRREPPRRRTLQSETAFLVITENPRAYWVGVRIPIAGPDEERERPAVLLLRSSSIFNSNLFFDWRLWLGVAFAVLAVSVLCWLPLIRGLTRSIGQMDRATEQIAQGEFNVQAPEQRQDELGHLGSQINRMAERLQSFVKNQKRFLGDIAHELCSPIARIQFAIGILEQRVAEPQQQHVAILRQEIQEMSSLVNELLMFSKAGLNPAEAIVTSVDVAAVAQRAIAREVTADQTVDVSIEPGLAALANEGALLRAISNLLRNALRYAGDDGPITIAACHVDRGVRITVSDCGPGLPEAALEEIFTPFYRPESARSRDTGGVGLGLAIVKTCVEACRGTVACRNRKPVGFEVTITLQALQAS